METMFLKVLNLSITASWLVLAVIIFRLLLKRAPKAINVIMWGLVGIRLICPFSFESVFSLVPSTEPIPTGLVYQDKMIMQSGTPVVNSPGNSVISESLTINAGSSVEPVQLMILIATVIWVIGILGMSLYAIISYFNLYRKVREAIPLQDNVLLCDGITTPFILGIIRPRIYLPSAVGESDAKYVIAHERAHLQRRDHWWKPLGFLLLTIFWFHPVFWIAYILLCRDIELACDEKVLKEAGVENKKNYSEALINCSVPRKLTVSCPLAFGEVGVKSRIKNVLNYKKPTFWVIVVAVLGCIVLAVGFLTNPVTTLDAKMQVFIDCQIAGHHQSKDSGQYACCLDWEVLGVEKTASTTTVYMWVLYEEYSNEMGLQLENGVHIPTVITAKKENGQYTLVEYWEPRDGSYYEDDIRDKFPWHLQGKALNSQLYIEKQQADCKVMANEYFSWLVNYDEEYKASDVSTETVDKIRKKYPQYFDLPIGKGLEVYVWQMSPETYCCGLLGGKNSEYEDAELWSLEGVSIAEMKAILSTYDISRNEIVLVPLCMPFSSYSYVVDKDYQEKLEELFWGN